ncbi:uncharacterized protein LOC115958238 [Quercus lobata]|uniref:uncharacterized protein LOC115958238 n=1 Tax=Quercus lobata TaxID=97700 RepID=UPI00124526CE|nr:uncharacterized protein LOC115958238 [Quercus lobata]
MFVARPLAKDSNPEPKRVRMEVRPTLSFSEKDKIGTIQPHDDALIGGYDVKRVLVDHGSGIEIMYPDLYKGLNLKPKDLTAYDSPLVSFDGKVDIPKDQIRLPIQIGSEVVEMDFIVVDNYSPYTAIVARPWLHTLGGCFFHPTFKDAVSEGAKYEKLEEIVIDGDSEKFFKVEAQLSPQEKEKLIAFLRENVDVFAWNAYEAPGVDPDFICRHMNVNLAILPKKQPPRRSSKEHSDAIKEEVNKLK